MPPALLTSSCLPGGCPISHCTLAGRPPLPLPSPDSADATVCPRLVGSQGPAARRPCSLPTQTFARRPLEPEDEVEGGVAQRATEKVRCWCRGPRDQIEGPLDASDTKPALVLGPVGMIIDNLQGRSFTFISRYLVSTDPELEACRT